MSGGMECDRCDGPIDGDDTGFVIDRPDADCSEYACRKCRHAMPESERRELRQILADALAKANPTP